MSTFAKYAAARELLQEFCRSHQPSLSYFHHGISFYLNKTEKAEKKFDEKAVRHLTSSVTCYESLLECRPKLAPEEAKKVLADAKSFARGAIGREPKDWISEGSAPIYCRCRALPFVIRNLGDWDERVAEHLKKILKQLKDESGRFGIGEEEQIKVAGSKRKKPYWYPANAYHTYWALQTLEVLSETFGEQFEVLDKTLRLSLRKKQLQESARRILGYQVALHSAKSSVLDSDQLAWALAALLRDPKLYQADLAQQDFVRQSFKCLFDTQTSVGTWRHYAPLFHYRESGNAYCYVFETLSELLKRAMSPNAEFIRTILQAHFDGLIRLFEYATSTAASLTDRQVADEGSVRHVGWSSGHRVNNSEPESWATASVFSFAEGLRRLLGIWTRDAALADLPNRTTYPTSAEAAEVLVERTNTWTDGQELTEQLYTMFINQVGLQPFDDKLDPDTPSIGKDFARSAILYGPPGASKTTIVRALAGVVGWDYVELHASHFVADGLPNVQRTADEIFQRLMQLDHAIVLFDEIDELVRERDDKSADAFGRFLTTSMLPKLAELWKRQKVMYFVATNHIEYFDRAITRAERFDAIVFVSPPAFEAKKNKLIDLTSDNYEVHIQLSVTQSEIDAAMPSFDDIEGLGKEERENGLSKPLDEENSLAKFALLRWDELSELAFVLSGIAPKGGKVNKDQLAMALRQLQDGRWRVNREYYEFQRDRAYTRRDFSKETVWKLVGLETDDADKMADTGRLLIRRDSDGNKNYYLASSGRKQIPEYEITGSENGTLSVKKLVPKSA